MTLQTYKQYFEEKLKFGKIHEDKAQKHVISYILKKHGKEYKLNTVREDGEFDFDIIDPESKNIISFEVKTDKRSKTTNNFYIEYNNGFGKPSGIEITTSDYHIINDETDYYLISTEKLKDIVEIGTWRRLATKKIFWNPFEDEVEKRITSWGHIIDKNTIIAKAKKIN